MKQYIDKAAVVEEIEKRQKEEVFYDEDGSFASWADQYHYSILESIKNFINTLEVKEVDINKEISQFIGANFEKATIGHNLSLRRVAKHFFELGLKAQKGE